MMNRTNFALFLSFFFISLSLFSQDKKKLKKEIKGFKIKSITEMVTEFNNGKESTRKDVFTAYDKNGEILSREDYHKDGMLKHKETNIYDSKGNKIEETIFESAEKQPKPEKNVKHTSKYDSNDNLIEDMEYDGTGKLMQKMQFSYNSKGDKILEVTFDSDGKLTKKTVYTFDSKGLRAEKKEYDGANTLISSRKYQYQF